MSIRNSNSSAVRKKPNFIAVIFNKIASSAPVEFFGRFFYNIGFSAELIFLAVWRIVRDGGIFLGQILAWFFVSVGKGIASVAVALWTDFKAPFVNIKSNMRSLKRAQRRAAAKGELVPSRQIGFVGKGIKSYVSVLLNILRYLLPVAAVIVFIFTANSLLNFRYALEVEIDGEVLGYISDDVMLEEALRVVQGRIKASDGKTAEDWKPEGVSLSLTKANSLTNKSQLTNNIMEFYARIGDRNDALVSAVGVMIDGELYAVTNQGPDVAEFLDGLLDEYRNPNEDGEVFFVNDVVVETGEDDIYFASSLVDFNTLTNNLESMLEVKKVVEVSYEEAVPFEIIYEDNNQMSKGYERVAQQGADGIIRVYENETYIDGELISVERLNEKTEVISEVVNHIIYVGTYVRSSSSTGASFGDGYLWPVPQYKTVSRGVGGSHKGLDITASAGTPILASRGGVVTDAGWSPYWSYGIWVVIEHDATYKTLYAHMSSVNVSTGDVVNAGDTIGGVGSTGRSTGNHLHFEVHENGSYRDPYNYVGRPS